MWTNKQTKVFQRSDLWKGISFPLLLLFTGNNSAVKFEAKNKQTKKSSLTSSWANIKHICSTSCEAPLKKIFTWCCEDDSSKKLNRIFSKKTERKILKKKSKLSKRWKCHCLRGPLAFFRLRPHKRDILKVKSRVKSSFSAK